MHLKTLKVQLGCPRAKSELDQTTDLSRGSQGSECEEFKRSFRQRNEEIKAELLRVKENMA